MKPAEPVQTPAQGAQHDGHHYITPPANITATTDGYLLEIDMPGVSKDGLKVSVEGNEITIIGRRKSELPQQELCYCETPRADFRRVFELGGDVDTSRISAEMRQGVLILRLPRSERAKPRQIQVTEE